MPINSPINPTFIAFIPKSCVQNVKWWIDCGCLSKISDVYGVPFWRYRVSYWTAEIFDSEKATFQHRKNISFRKDFRFIFKNENRCCDEGKDDLRLKWWNFGRLFEWISQQPNPYIYNGLKAFTANTSVAVLLIKSKLKQTYSVCAFLCYTNII